MATALSQTTSVSECELSKAYRSSAHTALIPILPTPFENSIAVPNHYSGSTIPQDNPAHSRLLSTSESKAQILILR